MTLRPHCAAHWPHAVRLSNDVATAPLYICLMASLKWRYASDKSSRSCDGRWPRFAPRRPPGPPDAEFVSPIVPPADPPADPPDVLTISIQSMTMLP